MLGGGAGSARPTTHNYISADFQVNIACLRGSSSASALGASGDPWAVPPWERQANISGAPRRTGPPHRGGDKQNHRAPRVGTGPPHRGGDKQRCWALLLPKSATPSTEPTNPNTLPPSGEPTNQATLFPISSRPWTLAALHEGNHTSPDQGTKVQRTLDLIAEENLSKKPYVS